LTGSSANADSDGVPLDFSVSALVAVAAVSTGKAGSEAGIALKVTSAMAVVTLGLRGARFFFGLNSASVTGCSLEEASAGAADVLVVVTSTSIAVGAASVAFATGAGFSLEDEVAFGFLPRFFFSAVAG
jgi:hypothetical protein